MLFTVSDDPYLSSLVEELAQTYGDSFLKYSLAAFAGRPNGRELAEEAVSLTYQKVLEHLSRRPFTGDIRKLYAFSIIVLRNTIADFGRSLTRNREDTKGFTTVMPREPEDLLAELCRKEDGEQLRRSIAALPEIDQTILFLRFSMDMPYKDIATALRISPSKVYCRAERALKKLRKKLRKE